MKSERVVATYDCETNPFKQGFPVWPFVWGFYDGSVYQQFWGPNCTAEFIQFLREYPDPLIAYAHNGGKFDALFLLRHIKGRIKTINNRIVQAHIGKVELRDSFANIPVPLADFGHKGKIDYALMEPFVRDKPGNKRLISDYLKQDCVGLYDAIVRYRAMFGNSITMASASMKQLNLTCTGKERETIYQKLTPKQDMEFRPYYFGGRVECFQSGVFENIQASIYDVTSMYPSTMRDFSHPISSSFTCRIGAAASIEEETDFAHITAYSQGTLPVRSKDGLRFPHGTYEFYANGAEIRKGLQLGTLKIIKLHRTITATERVHFRTFVDRFFTLRQQAAEAKDAMLKLFYKLVLNSAYGKLAMNPADFENMIALPDDELPEGALRTDPTIQCLPWHDPVDGLPCKCNTCFMRSNAWSLNCALPGLNIWSRAAPNTDQQYLNVATAASITAYTRATLFEGIHNAATPYYCDTDSIICRSLSNVRIGGGLGEWKHEATGTKLAIAGKKQYCMWGPSGELVKIATKGVRLTPEQMMQVAMGQTVSYTQEAPMFRLSAEQGFTQQPLTRKIKPTARIEERTN